VPTISLTTPVDAIPAGARSALLQDLGDALRRAERVPDNEFFQANTWAWLTEAQLHVGGGAPRFLVNAQVPEGGLNAKTKAELVSAATDLIAEAAGLPEEQRGSIWVLVNEIPNGNWGAGGAVIDFEQLRSLARAQREEASAATTG
jgi:phenylpyruvate tautomerase PptA (4-oxalocrotonate tautomerase family)